MMLREALTLERLRAMECDEAAAWFAAQRAEGLTDHEEALLSQWLADEANASAFDHARRAWDVFDRAEDDEILAAMRAHALDAPPRRRIGWPRAVIAAAAVMLLVLASALFLVPRGGPAPRPESQIAAVEYVSKPGEVRAIALPDGSTMTLDADSRALGRFDTRERSVELVRGRAFFDVRPDASRPFAVAAATRRVVALGTSFEVELAGNRLSVTLIEGRVAVEPRKPGAKTVTLAPGQRFVETDGEANVGTLEPQGAEPAGWRHGLLDFDDQPLSEAIAAVNRYSRAKIVIRDPALGAIRVSGQFRASDAERFARTVAEIHPVRVVRRADAIELVPAK